MGTVGLHSMLLGEDGVGSRDSWVLRAKGTRGWTPGSREPHLCSSMLLSSSSPMRLRHSLSFLVDASCGPLGSRASSGVSPPIRPARSWMKLEREWKGGVQDQNEASLLKSALQ